MLKVHLGFSWDEALSLPKPGVNLNILFQTLSLIKEV